MLWSKGWPESKKTPKLLVSTAKKFKEYDWDWILLLNDQGIRWRIILWSKGWTGSKKTHKSLVSLTKTIQRLWMSMILIVEWTGYKVKDNASVEKLTEQVKESPIWKVSPATMAVMGLAALPIISFLFIMLIGLSPAFLAFLAVEGTFLTVGAGIVTGLVVSVGGVVLSIATVMGSIYFAVTKIISFTKSKINNIQPHPSLK